MKRVLTIGLVLALVLMMCSCNKAIFDVHYKFDKAIVQRYDGEQVIEISSWTDYEDGEQLQIVDTEGNVWLLSSYNTILLHEAK